MNIEALVQSIKPQAAADSAEPHSSPAPHSGAAATTAGTTATAQPAPAAHPARAAVEAPTFDAIKAAAAQIDSYLKSVGRDLDIHVDHDTGRTVVVVRDSSTGDVIRQIPDEEALRLARSLGDNNSALVNLIA